MSRKDNWLEHEDQLLANTVLTYIEQGKTQLEAFDYVSAVLNRTAAGVGFRWNGFLRKNYEAEIKEAKSKKLIISKAKSSPPRTVSRNSKLDDLFEETIALLMTLDNEHKALSYRLSEALLRKEELDVELRRLKVNTPIVTPYNYSREDAEALKLIVEKAGELLSIQNKKPAI